MLCHQTLFPNVIFDLTDNLEVLRIFGGFFLFFLSGGRIIIIHPSTA